MECHYSNRRIRHAVHLEACRHVADKKPFLLRIDADALDALQRWAADELRSLNGQIEFLLRNELRRSGRLKEKPPPGAGKPKAPKGR